MLDKTYSGTVRPYLQLVDGRGTECVSSCHQHLFALKFEHVSNLPDGGGLANSIDTYNHNDRRPGGKVQASLLMA